MEYKVDPHSQEKFIAKRSHQRFARAKNRIDFHNEKAKQLREHCSAFNKPLHQNFLILRSIMQDKNEAFFHKQYLLGKGINFALHNHVVSVEEKNCHAIYDFAIVPIQNDQIKIVRL